MIAAGGFDITFELPSLRVMLIIACGIMIVLACAVFLITKNRE